MLFAPRHAVALLAVLLLPALPNLGPSAQAGLIHLGEPQLQINGDECQLVLINDPLKQDPSVWECAPADNLPLPDVVAFLRLPVLPQEGTSSSASSHPGGIDDLLCLPDNQSGIAFAGSDGLSCYQDAALHS